MLQFSDFFSLLLLIYQHSKKLWVNHKPMYFCYFCKLCQIIRKPFIRLRNPKYLLNQMLCVIRSSIGESSIKKKIHKTILFYNKSCHETEERHYPTQCLMLKKVIRHRRLSQKLYFKSLKLNSFIPGKSLLMFDNELSLCHFLVLTLLDRVVWVHCKKRLAIFPSQGEFCRDIIPGWDGKIANLFLQCNFGSRSHSAVHAFSAGDHFALIQIISNSLQMRQTNAQCKFLKKSTDFFHKKNLCI
jgi:hypothetical protein